jgi:hypothetical protein
MIDPVAAMLSFVTDAVPLIAGRAYAAPPGLPTQPATDATTGRPLPALVVQAVGGPPPPPHPVATTRFLLTCYGPTAEAAMGVYRALWDAVHDPYGVPRGPRRVHDRWVLVAARFDAAPAADVEPDTGYPRLEAVLLTTFDMLTGAAA